MNSIMQKYHRRSLLLSLALFLLSLSGCGKGAAPGSPGAQPGVEQVVLSISAVPSDVSCVRISAVGASRQVVREVDVVPGSSVTESFSGLPIGPVVFKGEAFPAACDSVAKSTVPAWVSQDETVNVTLTRTASVTLTLYRNGRAKATIEFEPEADAGGPTG